MQVDLSDINQVSKWFVLGNYPFNKGKTGTIRLANDADNSVVADAVMLIPDVILK